MRECLATKLLPPPYLPRGDQSGQFPTSRDILYAYDLIIFGETPIGLLNEGEMDWIRDFVEKRGGGIIFIDGPRQKLKKFGGTPILDLAPVEWIEDEGVLDVSKFGEAFPFSIENQRL